MQTGNFLKLKYRRTLKDISSQININLSKNKFDTAFRKKMLEELFLCRPDIITKEIIYNFYFKFDALIDSVKKKINEIARKHLISKLNKTRSKYTNKIGKFNKKGRTFILSDLTFLPAPFLKRMHLRLKYLRLDLKNLQEDYIKLSQIISIMTEKGYITSDHSKQYYRNIELEKVIEEYTQHRYNKDYLQLILEKLEILSVSYNKKSKKTEEIQPITKEKAQLKKNLTNHLNRCVATLEPEKKERYY